MNTFFAFAIIGPVGQVGRGSYLPLCHSSQNLSHNEVSTLCFWCLFNQRLNFTELSGYCCGVFSAFRRAFSIFKTQVNDEIRQESSLGETGKVHIWNISTQITKVMIVPMFFLCLYCDMYILQSVLRHKSKCLLLPQL